MVIIFSKQNKKNLYILAVAVILIVGLIIFWFFFLNKEEPVPGITELTGIGMREQRINIDFDLLESEIIKQLKPLLISLLAVLFVAACASSSDDDDIKESPANSLPCNPIYRFRCERCIWNWRRTNYQRVCVPH